MKKKIEDLSFYLFGKNVDNLENNFYKLIDILNEDEDNKNFLNEKERIVIEKRYLENNCLTLEEIGKNFLNNITRERVRMIEQKALNKLKNNNLALFILKNGEKPNEEPQTINDVFMSERLYNVLYKNNLTNLNVIREIDKKKLNKLNGMGAGSVKELFKILKRYNINYKGEDNLKGMFYDIFSYFDYHNKNLTKKQLEKLEELRDLLSLIL